MDVDLMTNEELKNEIKRMLYEIDDEEAQEEIYNYAVKLFEMEKNNEQWKDDRTKKKEHSICINENL